MSCKTECNCSCKKMLECTTCSVKKAELEKAIAEGKCICGDTCASKCE